MPRFVLSAPVLFWLLNSLTSTTAEELRHVVSREHPAIQGTGQGLTVGQDGNVYVTGVDDQGGYVLRVSRDGTQKFGATTTYAITGVAARADGVFATSNAHFAKSINISDPLGKPLAKLGGFTGNDEVGWDGPGTLEVGASGDFFALDQHAKRVVRVNIAGEIVRTYPLPTVTELAPHKLWTYGFRVHEPSQAFYFVVGPEVQCWGFDGKKRWSVPAAVSGEPWGGYSGGFDLDSKGQLFLNDGVSPNIRIIDREGRPSREFSLKIGDRIVNNEHHFGHLRVFDNDIILRQKSPSEIFQVYDQTTGAFKQAVFIDHEQITVTYPSSVWIAGKRLPLSIRFDAPGRPIKPNLKVWLRPLGTVKFTQWTWNDNGIDVPNDASGLYQLRVNSSAEGDRSEYQVEAVVEIRPENAVGAISIFTPLNRRSYRQGEPIRASLRLRTKDFAGLPAKLDVRLVDASGRVHHTEAVDCPRRLDAIQSIVTPPSITSNLPPGEYRLTTSLSRFTIAEQFLTIGTGREPSPTKPFYRIRHGDYNTAFPTVSYYNAPESINRHIDFTKKIGENMLVDRMGHGGGGTLGEIASKLTDPDLIGRLNADPIAVASEKAEFENRVLQTIAAYGATGIEQRAILLYMDAGLPIGTLYDKRKPEESARDARTVTQALVDYPAFGGWSWAANWWIEKRGAEMAVSEEEKKAYEAAMKAANETGRWDPVIETVSDRWFQHAVTAEKLFHSAMNAASPNNLVGAITAPYRQPGIHPPVAFAGADEVDLHFQAEQIQWPMISAHNVDFYKRPGRIAWGHPELWNDDGTGGQILSNLLQMVMRGANGVGQSGTTKGFASIESDPRGTAQGATSIHRQLNNWLAAYGPWLTELEARDAVAIPVSTRMMRMELGWQGVGGFYFTRLFEAYNACLRAHRPATFVFTEDCDSESLTKYPAVLLVSQTVELDPPLRSALQNASKAGVAIYSDQSCRQDTLKDYSPRKLNLGFTRIEKIEHLLNDDGAFWHYRDIILDHAKALREAWAKSVPPVAECDHLEVLLTERRLNDARVLWAVNDAAIPLDPGQLWRVSLAVGSRMPVLTELDWEGAKGRDVYELISGRKLDDAKPLPVDLRNAPARFFVSLPKTSGVDSLAKRVPTSGPRPVEEPFGVRIRDLVVSEDQRTALVAAAGWDQNAMLVDLDSGRVERREKVGHHFTYAPVSTTLGFAVQGYDLNTAEGYHLYLLNPNAKSEDSPLTKRFALYGLPKRGTSWALARQWQEPINNFAVSPDGGWIATAGDLGLIVWSREGKKLWSIDWWPRVRERRRLLAAGTNTLVAYDGSTATGYQPQTGEQRWSRVLGETGILNGAAANSDGSLIALRSTANGGRVFLLREGSPVNVLATPSDDLAISPDGNFAAVTWKDELRLYDTKGGLLWNAVADDILRAPRFSHDGTRIAVGSEIGSLYVYDTTGELRLKRDFAAIPVVSWLKDGGLLVGSWLGQLSRLGPDFQANWTVNLKSDADPRTLDIVAADKTPTVRASEWGNAAKQSAPLTPNLLNETQALIEARCEPTTHGDPRSWLHKIDRLRDGDPAPPDRPWLDWSDISYIDSGWRQKLVVQVDTFRSQIRLKGVSIVEDAAHPESWTRDTRLQWWDAEAELWRDGPYLLFNGPSAESGAKTVTHTHWFDAPLEAAKFRFVSTGGASWPVGNFRWGELVFHGEVLGPSHPDAVANRPVAVLFDEREDVLKNMTAYGEYPFAFRYDDAASGGKSLALTRAGNTTAYYRPPFGHVLPHWDFEIVQHPAKSGQYRWAEFAWKAAAPETKGVTLRLGPYHGGGLSFSAGEPTAFESVKAVQQSAKPPAKWETVRVDLWKLNGGQPFLIRSLSLGAVGGGAIFDRIRLSRAEADLDK